MDLAKEKIYDKNKLIKQIADELRLKKLHQKLSFMVTDIRRMFNNGLTDKYSGVLTP